MSDVSHTSVIVEAMKMIEQVMARTAEDAKTYPQGSEERSVAIGQLQGLKGAITILADVGQAAALADTGAATLN